MKKRPLILSGVFIFVFLLLISFASASWPNYVNAQGQSVTGASWSSSVYGRTVNWKMFCSSSNDYSVHPERYEMIGCDGDNYCCRCAAGTARFAGITAANTSSPDATCEPVATDNDGDGAYAAHPRFIKPLPHNGNDWFNVYWLPEYGDFDNQDCNDSNENISFSSPEVCDGIDNDCDGETDEGSICICYSDQDNDGFGNGTQVDINETCSEGYKLEGLLINTTGDCDDEEPLANPNMNESCDTPFDDDCNGLTNEGCSIIDAAHWEDLVDNRIDAADLNDTVKLSAYGASLSSMEINYSIYEVDGGFLWFDKKVATVSTKGEATWKATSPGRYYFKAVLSGQDEVESSDIFISSIIDDDPIVLRIIDPACGDYFDMGDRVNISIEVSDADDLLEANLTILNDVTPFSNGDFTFAHDFNTSGSYAIVLNAINGRGKTRRVTSSVMVIDTSSDGDYVASCIDEPEDLGFLPSGEVDFLAESSRGVSFVAPNTYNVVNASGLYFQWRFSSGVTFHNLHGTDPRAYDFFKIYPTSGNNWAVLTVELS
jgi:hypothetical protein